MLGVSWAEGANRQISFLQEKNYNYELLQTFLN